MSAHRDRARPWSRHSTAERDSDRPGARFQKAESAEDPRSGLTEREVEIVVLVVDGLSNVDIAARLNVSPRTVQSHLRSALRKTATTTRTQLAVHALRSGLVPLRSTGAD